MSTQAKAILWIAFAAVAIYLAWIAFFRNAAGAAKSGQSATGSRVSGGGITATRSQSQAIVGQPVFATMQVVPFAENVVPNYAGSNAISGALFNSGQQVGTIATGQNELRWPNGERFVLVQNPQLGRIWIAARRIRIGSATAGPIQQSTQGQGAVQFGAFYF